MASGSWQPVSAVCLKPSMWNGGNEHQGKGLVFILKNARESRQSGNALFPETLREELRAVRATVEAYSRSAKIEDPEIGDACGLMLSAGGSTNWNARLRVRSSGRSTLYSLDRWD